MNATGDGNALFAGNYCLLSASYSNGWIVDSGTTDHMCHKLDYLLIIELFRI